MSFQLEQGFSQLEVDALIRADKPFDLIIVPEWGHWGRNRRIHAYWTDRTREYLIEHLKP